MTVSLELNIGLFIVRKYCELQWIALTLMAVVASIVWLRKGVIVIIAIAIIIDLFQFGL